MNVVPQNNWDFYSIRVDQGIVVVGFHADADKIDQTTLPYCARVIIPIQHPEKHGGPGREEADVLWAMEDSLTEMLSSHGVKCLLLGRLTYEDVRELVFQLQDWETFRPPVGKWMTQYENLNIDVSEHDGWTFFNESVWPTPAAWALIFDRRVVDNLVESGSDPNKPHSLEFVFRGEASALEQMRTSLLGRDYALAQWNPTEGLLVMAKTMPLDLRAIYDAGVFHREECQRLGAEYDGWGSLVVE